MKIAINGFGRIGRPVAKIALEHADVELVAINDLGDINCLAYLLKHDSAYGIYEKDVEVKGDKLIVDGKEIQVFSEPDPAKLSWGKLDVDVVIESTGVFKDRESAKGHIEAGAKRVIISAPTKDDSIKTIVVGCNEKEITDEDDIVAMASCTTNCVTPMAKVLDDAFGIEKSLMSAIHSYTSTQNLVDSPSKKDLRYGRAAAQNIIPTTTGAAIAAAKAVPSLVGKFDGMAYRVPTLVGSVSDLVAVLKKDVSVEEINEVFKKAADGEMKNIMQVTEDPLVSSDVVESPYSAIVQLDLTKVMDGNLVKAVGWYDNEWGYSNRMVELAILMGK